MTTTTERLINEAYKRLPDALAIVDAGKVEDIDLEEYIVHSQKHHGTYYLVSKTACDCPDVRFNGISMCKHRLAVRIYRERQANAA